MCVKLSRLRRTMRRRIAILATCCLSAKSRLLPKPRIAKRAASIPRSADAVQNLGLLLERRGDLSAAEECFRRAIAQSPRMPSPRPISAICSRRQGLTTRLSSCSAQAIELNPTLAAAHRNLAEVHRAQERLPEATAAYRRAVELGADGYIGLATAA